MLPEQLLHRKQFVVSSDTPQFSHVCLLFSFTRLRLSSIHSSNTEEECYKNSSGEFCVLLFRSNVKFSLLTDIYLHLRQSSTILCALQGDFADSLSVIPFHHFVLLTFHYWRDTQFPSKVNYILTSVRQSEGCQWLSNVSLGVLVSNQDPCYRTPY